MHNMAVVRAEIPIVDYCIILVDCFFGIIDDFIGEVRQLLVGIRWLDRDFRFLI